MLSVFMIFVCTWQIQIYNFEVTVIQIIEKVVVVAGLEAIDPATVQGDTFHVFETSADAHTHIPLGPELTAH